MFLRHLSPAERSEIYCDHSWLMGHFWSKLKASCPSQTRRQSQVDEETWWVHTPEEKHKEEDAGRPGNPGIIQVYFFLPHECRVWTSPFRHITSSPHLSPASWRVVDEEAAICLCSLEGLKLLCKGALKRSVLLWLGKPEENVRKWISVSKLWMSSFLWAVV